MKKILLLMMFSMLLLMVGCGSAEETVVEKETTVEQVVQEEEISTSIIESEAEIVEESTEEIQQTMDEWAEGLNIENPALAIWNEQTMENFVLEDMQEYQMVEGDQVILVGCEGMTSFTWIPQSALENVEPNRHCFELMFNLEGKREITLNMDFEDKQCSFTATLIEPVVTWTEGMEKYSAYEKQDIDWPKGTIEEYVYTADNLFAHYVIKIDESDDGTVEVINGVQSENEGVNINYACDLPRNDGISVSGGGGLNRIMMHIMGVDGNEYRYLIQEKEISEADFNGFTGYEKKEFWDYLMPISDYVEDGYSDVNIQENEIRVFIEGIYNGGQSYIGCLIDKERNKILKFEWTSREERSISDEAISRFTNSLQIIDADYIEEY